MALVLDAKSDRHDEPLVVRLSNHERFALRPAQGERAGVPALSEGNGRILMAMAPTRSGKRVVFVCLEDGTGLADVAIFEDVQRESGDVLFKTPWLLVEGTVRRRGPRALSITAAKLERVEMAAQTFGELYSRSAAI